MFKKVFYGLFFLVLAACGQPARSIGSNQPTNPPAASEALPMPIPTVQSIPTHQPVRANLRDFGLAPELNNQEWFNTTQPLRLRDLRGRVVLLEMWTFGCINCQHVIPALKGWDAKYTSQGLTIIGNHFPEFAYEADLDNLKEAIVQAQIHYPVAVDNDGQTWNAYRNQYWPALYLIDKHSHIRFVNIGEGNEPAIEANIQALLAETYP